MKWLAMCLLGCAVELAGTSASAQQPPVQDPAATAAPAPGPTWSVPAASPTYGPSAAVLLGLATNDLNLGLGVRGGYTLPNNLYIGGTLVYHTGSSNEVTLTGATVTTAKTSRHLFYLGPEGGYDLAAGPVLVRPYLGIGLASASGSVTCSPPSTSCSSVSTSDTNFGIWVGGTLLYPLGTFFVGGDLRALFVQNANSLGVFATGGMTF